MSAFSAFVILGTMRTGSNFLEASLSDVEGLSCFGELYNPNFIGKLKQDTLLGYDIARREDDPLGLLEAVIASSDGLPGFRLFNGHDPRVLAHVLADPSIAKIILRRDPAFCYLSLRHAQVTGQWRSGDFNRTRTDKVTIDRAAFFAWRGQINAHYADIDDAVRRSGQTSFAIDYDELHDVGLLNGIAAFLGVEGRLETVSNKIKKQIADPPSVMIENWDEVADLFETDTATHRFRSGGPGVNRYLAAAGVALLYMPVPGGSDRMLDEWFSSFGDALTFNQASLRQWREETTGLRSFTIVRHPMDRLIALYFSDIRSDLKDKLERRYQVRFTPHPSDDDLIKFARIVRATASTQTSIKAPPGWAPQSDNLRDLTQLSAPDHVFRDETLEAELLALCERLGIQCPPLPEARSLRDFHSAELDAEARALWGVDYVNFGYAALSR